MEEGRGLAHGSPVRDESSDDVDDDAGLTDRLSEAAWVASSVLATHGPPSEVCTGFEWGIACIDP